VPCLLEGGVFFRLVFLVLAEALAGARFGFLGIFFQTTKYFSILIFSPVFSPVFSHSQR
jgi:hypothetical protein